MYFPAHNTPQSPSLSNPRHCLLAPIGMRSIRREPTLVFRKPLPFPSNPGLFPYFVIWVDSRYTVKIGLSGFQLGYLGLWCYCWSVLLNVYKNILIYSCFSLPQASLNPKIQAYSLSDGFIIVADQSVILLDSICRSLQLHLIFGKFNLP